jgi:hypothetical protein
MPVQYGYRENGMESSTGKCFCQYHGLCRVCSRLPFAALELFVCRAYLTEQRTPPHPNILAVCHVDLAVNPPPYLQVGRILSRLPTAAGADCQTRLGSRSNTPLEAANTPL